MIFINASIIEAQRVTATSWSAAVFRRFGGPGANDLFPFLKHDADRTAAEHRRTPRRKRSTLRHRTLRVSDTRSQIHTRAIALVAGSVESHLQPRAPRSRRKLSVEQLRLFRDPLEAVHPLCSASIRNAGLVSKSRWFRRRKLASCSYSPARCGAFGFAAFSLGSFVGSSHSV
jgi:hypothetical protein